MTRTLTDWLFFGFCLLLVALVGAAFSIGWHAITAIADMICLSLPVDYN